MLISCTGYGVTCSIGDDVVRSPARVFIMRSSLGGRITRYTPSVCLSRANCYSSKSVSPRRHIAFCEAETFLTFLPTPKECSPFAALQEDLVIGLAVLEISRKKNLKSGSARHKPSIRGEGVRCLGGLRPRGIHFRKTFSCATFDLHVVCLIRIRSYLASKLK